MKTICAASLDTVINYLFECSNRNWINYILIEKLIDLNQLTKDLHITDINVINYAMKICRNYSKYFIMSKLNANINLN